MLFFTVVLFAFYLLSLFAGKVFQGTIIKIGEAEIEHGLGKITKEEKDLKIAKQSIAFILFGLTLLVVLIVYMINAISMSGATLATSLFIMFQVLNLGWNLRFNNKKNFDFSKADDVQRYRKKLYKNRTVKGTILNLIYLAYFGYMAYLQIGL